MEGHIRFPLIACDKETGDKLSAELNGGDIPTTGVFAVAANRQHLDRRADSELWRVRSSTRDNCGAFDYARQPRGVQWPVRPLSARH